MEKEEILNKVQKKKVYVGEMEKTKVNKACWIANIIACVVAVAMMIVQGCLGHHESVFVIASICLIWACVFYSCQYFVAKRPWPVLIGAVLEGLGACTMITLYILTVVGVL